MIVTNSFFCFQSTLKLVINNNLAFGNGAYEGFGSGNTHVDGLRQIRLWVAKRLGRLRDDFDVLFGADLLLVLVALDMEIHAPEARDTVLDRRVGREQGS